MDLDYMDHYDSVVEISGEDVSMVDSEADKVRRTLHLQGWLDGVCFILLT